MAVTYKDIDLLTQKSAVAGTEKIPVSDTQYLTPDQIAVQKRVYLEDESDMPATPDADTLYLIEEPNATYEQTSNKVTSLSSSSTDTQYPSAKCVYDNLATKQKTITVSSSSPTSSDGVDGDIWIVI